MRWARRSLKRPRRAMQCSPQPSTSRRRPPCGTTGSSFAIGGLTFMARWCRLTERSKAHERAGRATRQDADLAPIDLVSVDPGQRVLQLLHEARVFIASLCIVGYAKQK